jgi:hypothetical protein
MICPRDCMDESGSALLLVLFALTLLSLLGFFMSLSATTGVEISDNYESHVQATYGALAGLHHARVLFRGLDLNDLLKGPDGVYDTGASYMSKARSFEFRNPVPLLTALTLDLIDPAADVAGIPDDGWISTGFYSGARGVDLIPGSGIVLTAPNPYGPGTIATSRYFVKVSDNNGEVSEIAGDAANNPFVDGDGIVIVRALGTAKTVSSATELTLRRNSVAFFEARFKRFFTWDLGPALAVLGPETSAEFSASVEISGGLFPGIGTIDTISGDLVFPDQIIRAAAGAGEKITGGAEPIPSILDITHQVCSNADQRLLMDPGYLWNFIHTRAREMADNFYEGNQSWLEGRAPGLGVYNPSKPWNAPGQDPKITVVQGDLQISGGLSGGGLLIVTGNFSYSGAFAFSGLVIVAGSGRMTAAGSGSGIEGGVLVANLMDTGGGIAFGSSSLSLGANSRIVSNKENVRMAIGLIPVVQISFREIAGSDP